MLGYRKGVRGCYIKCREVGRGCRDDVRKCWVSDRGCREGGGGTKETNPHPDNDTPKSMSF